MLVVDLLALVLIVLVVGVGYGAAKRLRGQTPRGQLAEYKRQGRLNTETFDVQASLVCASCTEPIDPQVDLLVGGTWYHRNCWKQLGDSLNA